MVLGRFLMAPGNAVWGRRGVTNEHERGMMQWRVNMLICTALAVIGVVVGWKIFA